MAWIETESLSFVARHEAEDTECAQRTLDALEDLRLRLEERFDGGARRDNGDRSPDPCLAGRRPPVPSRRPARGRPGRPPLSGRLGDGHRAPRPERRVPRPPRGRRGLDGRAARNRRAALRAGRGRREQRPAAAAVGPASLRPLSALDLADRGRRPVLRGPGAAVSSRRQHPASRPKGARLPALAARRDHPREARSSTCSSETAAATRATCWPRACAATDRERRSSSHSTRAFARSSESGATTCEGSASAASTTRSSGRSG